MRRPWIWLAVLVTLTATSAPASLARVAKQQRATSSLGAPSRDEYAEAWYRPGEAGRNLRLGAPAEAGMVPEHIARIDDELSAGLQPSPTHPRYPGAVVLVAKDGIVVKHDAYGHAYKYSDSQPTLLPEDERVPMRRDTIFDLASVSKLFTSIAVVQLIERDAVELDETVATYIPEFAQNGKGSITVEQLLTHTSGMAAWMPLYRNYSTPEERIAAVYAAEPQSDPGTTYRYSDLNLIVLGELVESVTGKRLDRYVADHITAPLGMSDTGFNPPQTEVDRIAATEYQPWTDRGMIRGSVHDENAWSLGGVAGHAGLFSTARDLAVLAQTLLNGGGYGGTRILSPDSVVAMATNYNQSFPGDDHGLGFELYQHWYMDAMSTPFSAGHTGFTGTSLVIDPLTDSFAILLTNRVHPSRDWGTINPYRRAVARASARAVPVRPASGPDSWFSGLDDAANDTLTTDVRLPGGPKELEFDLWFDTEPTFDVACVEASDDGGDRWRPLEGTVGNGAGATASSDGCFTGFSGRRWSAASFDLSALHGDVQLRWRYSTDSFYQGRGVYVDNVKVKSVDDVLLNDDKAEWRSNGWEQSSN